MPESVYNVSVFLVQAVVVSLSGVMAPGAITAATLAAGTRAPHAGAWVAVGHGIVEFPLMLAIMAGMGTVFQLPWVKTVIGAAGGAILLWMAGRMLWAARKGVEADAAPSGRGPLVTGVVLSAGNPYFLIWWATVGLRLSLDAIELGALAFALFAVVHWLCDLVWLEALSGAAHRGATLLGGRSQQGVLLVSGVALAAIGVRFLLSL